MAELPELSALIIQAQAIARRMFPWLIPGLLILLALVLRFVHLLYPKYYLLSPDSYYWHWSALRIMDGQGSPPNPPPLLTFHNSAIAYPLAYMGDAVSFAFHVSHAEALTVVCKVFPPLFLGLIGLIVMYLVAARISNRRVGLFAAFTWACMYPIVLITSAGFIDRDGIETLLLMLGVVVFYLGKDWHFRVGSRDLGWLVSSLTVLAIMAMLYLCWGIVGCIILIAIIAAYFVVSLVVALISSIRTQRGTRLRIASALGKTNWRGFAFIIVCSAVGLLAYHADFSYWTKALWYMVQGMGQRGGSAELNGAALSDFMIFYLFLIPIAIGLVVALYSAWKSRSNVALLMCTWTLLLLVLSLFSRRVLVFAAAPACILSGIGLAFVWGWAKLDQPRLPSTIGAIAILLVLVVTSLGTSYAEGNGKVAAADAEWQDALTYLRQETPQDAVIMTQWSWGYWILDLGQRIPYVDNGYYGYTSTELRDVGVAYTTSDPSVAAEIMQRDGVDYLVFSKFDSDVASTIVSWAGLETLESFPEDSLFSRSINGEFELGGGLQVVYRSKPDSEVVVLKLIQ
jgi:asparagine N-glycosylation enzyme membrane subunit Stt3